MTFWTRLGASAGAMALPWTSLAFEPGTVSLLLVERPPPACAVAGSEQGESREGSQYGYPREADV